MTTIGGSQGSRGFPAGEAVKHLPRLTVPDAVVAELSAYLVARGLDADPESPINRGAHLIGKATEPPAW